MKLSLIPIALLAAACAEAEPVEPMSAAQAMPSRTKALPDLDPTRFIRYACTDGSSVEAAYSGRSTMLRYKDEAIPMTTVPSASGARYIGGGWQWWTKGSDRGTLAPLAAGETYASARGVDCATS